MIANVIKSLTVILGYIYIYSQISYISTKPIFTREKRIFILLLLTTISIILCYSYEELSYSIPLLIFWIVVSYYTRQPQKSFVSTALSFTISFGIYGFACILVSLVLCLIFTDKSTFPFILLAFLSAFLQNIAIYLLCKTKRFRKGMPFLTKHNFINIATFISIFLVFFLIYVVENNHISSLRNIGVITPLITLAFLIYWWQAQITKSYRRSLESRELESLKTEVTEQNILIQRLIEENERLARITHRDNTLISTLKNSTVKYLATDFETVEEAITVRDQLISNINTLSEGRASLPPDYSERTAREFHTDISLLNDMLTQMDGDAIKENITFSVHLGTKLKDFVPQDISESDLVHLIDDLLKNAFKSTRTCEKRVVQLQFYKLGKHFVVEVADNGIPFEVESLVNLGIEKRTTYADGSGIGLMDIWNTKENCGATYHIEEYETPAPFSKKISLTFDKKNRYSIRTWRKDEVLQMSKRADLQVYGHNE